MSTSNFTRPSQKKVIQALQDMAPSGEQRRLPVMLDLEMHTWIRQHAVGKQTSATEIVRELLREYRQKVEGQR